MKNLLAIFAVALLITSISSAQDIWGQGKMRAGVGGTFALPMGTWGDAVGIGVGGFGKFEYGINEDMVVQGSLGYLVWMEKDLSGVKSSASAMPIIGAFKYNLSKLLTPGLYGFAEFGIWSLTQKIETPAFTIAGFTFPASSVEVTSSESVLAIGAGYDTGMLDISAKYLLKGNFDNLVFGVAYNFGL